MKENVCICVCDGQRERWIHFQEISTFILEGYIKLAKSDSKDIVAIKSSLEIFIHWILGESCKY